VGGKTQAPLLKARSESLRLDYAQFLELEVFTRFGTMVDERTQAIIDHGRRIRAILCQPQFEPLALGLQVALLTALAERLLDRLPIGRIGLYRAKLEPWLRENCPEMFGLDGSAETLGDELAAALVASLRRLAEAVGEETGTP
jgi:F0F1-type ATP synthase alpha subunit